MSKIKSTIYNIAREKVKNYLTNNLGKVVEEEDKLVCYVEVNKIKKDHRDYHAMCYGVGEKDEKLVKLYKLNKPIYYIFDNIDLFTRQIRIGGYNHANIIIKNCNFNLGGSIDTDGECVIDNSSIRGFHYFSIHANDLTIKNDANIENTFDHGYILLKAINNLQITDTTLGAKEKNTKFMLDSDHRLDIKNSKVFGKLIECNAPVVTADDETTLNATGRVIVDTEYFNHIRVLAPTVLLADKEYQTDNKEVTLKQFNDPLSIKRLELINVLSNIRDKCIEINSRKLASYEQELSSESIKQIVR